MPNDLIITSTTQLIDLQNFAYSRDAGNVVSEAIVLYKKDPNKELNPTPPEIRHQNNNGAKALFIEALQSALTSAAAKAQAREIFNTFNLNDDVISAESVREILNATRHLTKLEEPEENNSPPIRNASQEINSHFTDTSTQESNGVWFKRGINDYEYYDSLEDLLEWETNNGNLEQLEKLDEIHEDPDHQGARDVYKLKEKTFEETASVVNQGPDKDTDPVGFLISNYERIWTEYDWNDEGGDLFEHNRALLAIEARDIWDNFSKTEQRLFNQITDKYNCKRIEVILNNLSKYHCHNNAARDMFSCIKAIKAAYNEINER